MQSLTKWVLTTFTSPIGLFVLAALDSTLFFSLPFGIDAAVIILAARSDKLAWMVPLIATAGSAAGAALTFWMGTKVGEKGLDRYVPARRLEGIRGRLKKSGAIAFGIVDLIPPPFPFTAVVLAAGALEVKTALFFVTLVVTRLMRFGVESWLAARYGKRILSTLESPFVEHLISVVIVLAAILTILGLIRLFRSSRPASRRRAAA
jgi:membrane protein YqaA with SNARE-associated domain